MQMKIIILLWQSNIISLMLIAVVGAAWASIWFVIDQHCCHSAIYRHVFGGWRVSLVKFELFKKIILFMLEFYISSSNFLSMFTILPNSFWRYLVCKKVSGLQQLRELVEKKKWLDVRVNEEIHYAVHRQPEFVGLLSTEINAILIWI